METVSLEEVQRHPGAILARAQAGEAFLVVQADRAVLEIRPVGERRTTPRPFGLCRGEFVVPNSFDEPLPEDVLQSFEAP